MVGGGGAALGISYLSVFSVFSFRLCFYSCIDIFCSISLTCILFVPAIVRSSAHVGFIRKLFISVSIAFRDILLNII